MAEVESIYRELETQLLAWARGRGDVRAIAAVGSRAQPSSLRDAWSDLDVVLVVKKPRRFVATDEWIREIEEPYIGYVIKTPLGEGLARGAIFRDGLATIDFAILGRSSLLAATLLLRAFSWRPSLSRLLPPPFYGQMEAFARMISGGARVLLDKDRLITRLTGYEIAWRPHRALSEQTFLDAIGTFFGIVIWAAKKLRRGDLWRCAVAADHDVKELLLGMIEWHALAFHGDDYETWYLGRYMHRWADPRIVEAIPGVFAGYEPAELRRCLGHVMELYCWIAREVAERSGYAYPRETEQRARRLVSFR